MKPKPFLFTLTARYGSVFGIIDAFLFVCLFVFKILIRPHGRGGGVLPLHHRQSIEFAC